MSAPSRTIAALVLVVLCGCGGKTLPESEPAPGPGPGPSPLPGPSPGPAPAPGPGTRCAGSAPGPGYECVQDCGEPVAREDDPEPGWSWLSPAHAESRRMHGCPICLPSTARIAAPQGAVPISRLREGDPIWSRDETGRRIAARVRAVRSVPVPPAHRLVRIELSDGRVVLASPLHPLVGGDAIRTLQPGAALDGAAVEQVELVPYGGDRTWDVLPSGPTGDYWADGVPLGSTLAPD